MFAPPCGRIVSGPRAQTVQIEEHGGLRMRVRNWLIAVGVLAGLGASMPNALAANEEGKCRGSWLLKDKCSWCDGGDCTCTINCSSNQE